MEGQMTTMKGKLRKLKQVVMGVYTAFALRQVRTSCPD